MSVKKTPFKDIADLSVKELISMRRDLKKQEFEARMKNSLKALKETHIISTLKKNIARVNTALTRNNNTH